MAKKKQASRTQKGLFASLSRPTKKPSVLEEHDIGEVTSFLFLRLKKETVFRSASVLVFLVATLCIFSLFGKGGLVGSLLLQYSLYVFGILGYIACIPFFILSYYLFVMRAPRIRVSQVLGIPLFVFSFLAIPNLYSNLTSTVYGGKVGDVFAYSFNSLFSYYPSLLFLTVLACMSLGILFDYIPHVSDIKDILSRARSLLSFSILSSLRQRFSRSKGQEEDEEYIYDEDESQYETEMDVRSEILGTHKKTKASAADSAHKKTEQTKRHNEDTITYTIKDKTKGQNKNDKETAENKRTKVDISDIDAFVPPPLSLLQKDSGRASVGDIKAKASVIKRTLSEFGISVEMDEVSVGPSVTRYALKPAQGVKLSRIAGHRQELAYALEAESIRIEAPIPGKSLVGIEIPNDTKAMVGLASLLSESAWRVAEKPLLVALGKGVSGNAVYSNLAKMPHLLIAGTTGSGKSVMVHSIINSLLFRNSPQDLKFIMVDPKKVELTIYNNIPHLYTPVITNAKVTIRTLSWAVNEMERRYDILESYKERDISSYHKNVFQKEARKQKGGRQDGEESLPERMPYIVIIIDELADIMMSYPKELEAAIVRLAQKSRAVGIHLILSTQRPSVNVITGLIKANIPSRIALKVASQIDSRTIIDTAGAEQLLGQGDLLFTSSENPKQERVQSAFMSDAEVKRVVDYLKQTYRDMLPDEINIESTPGNASSSALFSTDLGSVDGGDTDDDLFEEAKEIVVSSQKASTSYLQRRLKIGYSRAARLMDMLEERGVIGVGDGAKAREVLVGRTGDSSPLEAEEDSDEKREL